MLTDDSLVTPMNLESVMTATMMLVGEMKRSGHDPTYANIVNTMAYRLWPHCPPTKAGDATLAEWLREVRRLAHIHAKG